MVMPSIAVIVAFKKLNDYSGGLLLPPLLLGAAALGVYFALKPKPSVSLAGRRIVVTGAARGIGRAVAELAVARGAAVDLWDVDARGAEAARAALAPLAARGARVAARAVDVGDEASWAAAVAALGDGGAPAPDAFVACAGVLAGAHLADLGGAALARTLAVNVGGAARAVQAAVAARAAREAAAPAPAPAPAPVTVVLLGSVMGWLGAARLGDYCASKWAVNGLADVARLEVNARWPRGGAVGVHLVCPYVVDTDLFAGAFGAPPRGAPLLARLLAPLIACLLPRLRAARVAAAVLDAVALAPGKHRVAFLPWFTRFLAQVPRVLFFAKLSAFDALVAAAGGQHGMDGWGAKAGAGAGAGAGAAAPAAKAARAKSPAAGAKSPAARAKSPAAARSAGSGDKRAAR